MTGIFPHFFQDPVERECLTIRPISRHRVKRVSDHDYASAKRNLLAGQAIRISTAVVILMVVTDRLLNRAAETRNCTHELSASDWM